MNLMPLYELTEHAKDEITRRQIPMDMLEQAMNSPQNITTEVGGRKCYQSIFTFPNGKKYLIRLIVEDRKGRLVLITGYKTSKIGKYIKE